ncbi:nucleotidyltransferase family protein [Hydrogenobacter thermophilus]|uniref:nucleotidyltransferase family protein n=1 Tax=Hydrogenobacter thermophilus TaxID=940 RepID=UPI0030FBB45B
MNEIRKNKTVGFFILAAGRCERFGAPKFLFPYEGMPLLKRLLEKCLIVEPEHTYIITGAYHKEIASKVENGRLIYNPKYSEGMASSIRLVSEKATELELEAIVLILSDQPFVNDYMLRMLINRFNEGYDIVSFEKNGEPCPPSLFSRRYYKALAELKGDTGAKKIIKEAKRKEVIRGFDHLLEDFDNVWDYLRLTSEDPLKRS